MPCTTSCKHCQLSLWAQQIKHSPELAREPKVPASATKDCNGKEETIASLSKLWILQLSLVLSSR